MTASTLVTIGSTLPTLLAAVLALHAGAASAGPVADFEKALAAAYAPYRAALMQTNQKDKAATEQSLGAFEARWTALTKIYRTAPPPQYADDERWPATLASVDQTIEAAKSETARGDLAKAHDVLESIRRQLGDLRTRNGVITFSDRMDAYHEKMEEIAGARHDPSDTAALARLRENAAVLAYLAQGIEKHPPAAAATDPTYKDILAGLTSSVDALLSAVRSGDALATAKAISALKPSYARMFVKFG